MGEERENIKSLITLLGGASTDKFNKKDTHILVKEPTGVKYERAMEWYLPKSFIQSHSFNHSFIHSFIQSHSFIFSLNKRIC